MKALIDGTRVCQLAEEEFEVAEPLVWVEATEGVTTDYTYESGDFVPPVTEVVQRLVHKRVIVDRLEAAGKLAAARAALDSADLYTQERWNSREAIYSDDPTAVALLVAIGADPEVILG